MRPAQLFFVVFVIWLAVWSNFIARDLYKGGHLAEYKALARSNAEGKRAITYGEHFYEFLKFAKETLPPNAGYKFVGRGVLSKGEPSLARRRGVYYLYPLLEKKDKPDYILFYEDARRGTGVLQTATGSFQKLVLSAGTGLSTR